MDRRNATVFDRLEWVRTHPNESTHVLAGIAPLLEKRYKELAGARE